MRNTKNIDKFLTLMSSLTNLYFTLKRLSRKQFKISKKPSITPGILTSIKHKNKLYAKFLKNRPSDPGPARGGFRRYIVPGPGSRGARA